MSEDQPLRFQRDVIREEQSLARRGLELGERESARKLASGGGASSAISAFFGASLLWLIFGSVFLGIFVKLSQSVPFALVIGLVFVAIIVWRGVAA